MKISKLFALLTLLVMPACNVYSQVIPYTDEEKEMFQLHYDDMSFGIKIASEDECSRLICNYNVTQEVLKKLVDIVLEREWKKAALNYSGLEPMKRYNGKVALDSIYQRYIDAMLMPDNDIAGAAIRCALKMKKEISLSDNTYQKIVDGGLPIAYELRKNPNYNSITSEMKVLRANLNSKHINKVLREKNKNLAWEKSWESWKAILENKLAVRKDSVKVCRQFTGYYLDKLVYTDMFCDNNSQRLSYLAGLEETKPDLLGKLDSIAEMNKRLRKMRNNNTNYQW